MVRQALLYKMLRMVEMKSTKEVSVLYAEDNEDSGFMLSTLLGYSGITVSLARTIKEAVQTARCSNFDLYLLDSGFPDGSGFELCRELVEISSKTPIVFYSGYGSKADRQKGLDAGARAYIVKPEVDSVAATIFQCVA
jgi:two-component system, OmpR family, catabolic regulation response regulator CreB